MAAMAEGLGTVIAEGGSMGDTAGEVIRCAAKVAGRVQGVSFRYYTARLAWQLELTGWVRNAADGSVELEVQGEVSAVEALLDWAASGPPHARVERLVRSSRALVEVETEFSVRY